MSVESIPGPLVGIVVLDASDNLPGKYAGQLLADMGADVIRIEDTVISASDEVILRNRRLLAPSSIQTADELFEAAVQVADIVLAGTPRQHTLHDRAVRRGQIHASVSSFGSDSPWSDRPGDDLIVQALAGAMEVTGEPGRPPVRMGAPVLSLMAGAQLVVGVLAALQESPSDENREVDVSLLDVSLSMLSYLAPLYLTLGKVPERVGSGHPTIYPYNAFEVADGYVVVAPFTGRFWRKFCDVLEHPEWGQDERFKNFQDRLDNRSVLEPLLNEIMKTKSRAEWLMLLEAGDVPCGSVNNVAEALSMEQTAARELVVTLEDVTRSCVAMPIKFTYANGAQFVPTYRPAITGSLADVSSSLPRSGTGAAGAPLAGIRVIDLTRMAAGPFCTEMLSDLGADVIKVEEPGIGDPTRRNVPIIDGISSYFLAFNRGKRSLSVDMKSAEGLETVLALVKDADVVVENFRPGVMERLGLSYDALRSANDRVILASISGFGQTGPLRLKTSFDLVNQAIAGMLSITGETGRDPVRLGLPVGDLAGGQYTALGIMAALVQRQRTGRGSYVDVSLHDILIALLGSVAQEYLDTHVLPERTGSRYPGLTATGAYEARDGYIAIEAATDEAWLDLVERLQLDGSDSLTRAEDRARASAEVEQLVMTAVQSRSVSECLDALEGSRVGAAAVLNVGGALDSEHATARSLVVTVPLPSGGQARTVGSAFHFDGAPVVSAGGPPDLGEHNGELLDAPVSSAEWTK